MHKVSTDFLKISASELEYGLHFAAVFSRWAHLNEVGALEDTTFFALMQINGVFSAFSGVRWKV